MHTIDNHILGNNRRSKVNFQNPRGEDLVHTSTLLSVPLRSLCDNGNNPGFWSEVFLHTSFQPSGHAHHNIVRLHKFEDCISIV